MADQTFTSGQILTAAQMTTLQANSGLVPMVPSSVAGTGVTVSTSGLVTFAAASTASVNGVFTTLYKNYKVLINVSNSSQVTLSYNFRVSGSDNGTANYSQQRLIADSTSVSGVRATGQTSGLLGQLVLSDFSFFDCTMFQPFEATKTGLIVHNDSFVGGAYITNLAGQFGAATSFDGFTIFPASGTITGTMSVYGYRS
jgi:hypothetical protein